MISLDYMAGLFDGEGCLMIAVSFSKETFTAQPIVKINMVDRSNILDRVHNAFHSFGIKSFLTTEDSSKWYKNAKQQTLLRISSVKSCLKFYEIFHERLHEKRAEIEAWKKAIDIISLRTHRTWSMQKALELMCVVEEIRSLRSQRVKPKWTYESVKQRFKELE